MNQRKTSKEFPVFSISDVLAAYGGEDVQSGYGWRPYKCPFHKERSASASVNADLNVFVCHACGIKGNAVQCVMKYEGMSYADALKHAEEVIGAGNTPVHGQSHVRSSRLSRRQGNSRGSSSFRRNWSGS